ncbi:hypothetical protein Fmac_031300 [Flemingia macrophylla]|uniref:Exocyst subunit Exo70 family protein n=1 Tax=Flemingia macrophylla TaxID=520843 RepID=A0ABD1L1N7_9FABA
MNRERIKSWLQQPKVWRFVCFVLSIIGVFLFALSSTFNDLFGQWKWWKIFLYIVFSSTSCLAVFFTKAWPPSASLSLEARVGFSFLMVTSFYSFYFDKLVKVKPDAYSLVSLATFAIMSVGLSRVIHFGFGVDLLYYFCGLLTVQLMKIKFWLFIVGGSFSCPLIRLCYTPLINNRDIELPVVGQDVESGSLLSARSSVSQSITTTSTAISPADTSLENEDEALLVIQVDSVSQDTDLGRKWALLQKQLLSSFDECFSMMSSFKHYERIARDIRFESSEEDKCDDDSIQLQLMDCIKELEKENEKLIPMVCSHVEKYLKAIVDSEQTPVYPDVNLMKDALPSATIRSLQTTVKLMMSAGLGMKSCHVYSNWRREFIEQCLTELGLQLQALHIGDWVKTCKAAANILFPIEWILCHDVFFGFSEAADVSFTMVCTKLTIPLLSFVDIIVSSGSYLPSQLFSSSIPKMRESLHELTQVFKSFRFSFSKVGPLLGREADRVLKRLDILIELENIIYRNTAQATVSGGGVHPTTQKVMNYIREKTTYSTIWQAIVQYDFVVPNRGWNSLFSVQIARMIELLESNLQAMSRDYNSALGYVFMMNNLHYIGHEASKLRISLGEDWFQKNTAKVDQNLELYLSSSWNKILDFLKLESYDSQPRVPDTVAESMKDKLKLFNLHFDEICNVQSTWIVSDKKLRERIITSIENVLVMAYGIFIGRFQIFVGNHAFEYIEHGIEDIAYQLSCLFLVNE